MGVVDDVVVVERAGIVSVVVIETSVSVGDDLVALVSLLAVEQFLQSDDSGQQEGQLADDQSLEGNKSQESNSQGQQSSGLQLEEQQKGQEHLLGLLLATSYLSERKWDKVVVMELPSLAMDLNQLTLLERALHVIDRVLGDLELDGMRSQETGNAVNQERVNLSLTGLGLSGQDDLVQ